MKFLLIATIQLTRSEKTVVDNCFEKNADVNVFVDTQQIFVTLTPTLLSSCDFPHGVKLSLAFDNLSGFEPYGFQYDYVYDSDNVLNVSCSNAVVCANLSQVTTAQIIMESKTLVTYVASGSVRVSRGQFDDCLNQNSANIYLGIGYVLF